MNRTEDIDKPVEEMTEAEISKEIEECNNARQTLQYYDFTPWQRLEYLDSRVMTLENELKKRKGNNHEPDCTESETKN